VLSGQDDNDIPPNCSTFKPFQTFAYAVYDARDWLDEHIPGYTGLIDDGFGVRVAAKIRALKVNA